MHRGELGIHAAKRPLCIAGKRLIRSIHDAGFIIPKEFWFGKLLGTVDVLDCKPTDDMRIWKMSDWDYLSGNFEPGRFAWRVTVKEVFLEPIPLRGKQGFWWAEIEE